MSKHRENRPLAQPLQGTAEQLKLIPDSLSGKEALHPYLQNFELDRVALKEKTDLWGAWYESQLTNEARLMKGQYFTPDSLCDLMLALTLEDSTDRILEPGCGTGAFLLRAYEQLEALGNLSHSHRLNQLLGVELDAKAGFLSACQLMEQPLENSEDKPLLPHPLLPHLWIGDFLSADFNSEPPFDVVIGNPPYVRHEHLRQQTKFCFETAKNQIEQDYTEYLRLYPQQKKLFRGPSDLYLWFFLKATPLLRPGGRLAFVTSNGWLTASYGKPFQHFLEHHFELVALLEPTQEIWFEDAAINPVITVLRRRAPRNSKSSKSEPTGRLIRFQKDLNSLSALAPAKKSKTRRDGYQTLSRQLLEGTPIEGIKNEKIILSDSTSPWRSWMFQLKTLNQFNFLFESSEKPATKNHWISLEDLGAVRYPLKTGINRFFYVTPEVIQRFGIEAEFLFPVLKSTKNITHLTVNNKNLNTFLFSCLVSMDTLKKTGKLGALSYIQWGAQQQAGVRQKRHSPVYWPEVPSVKNRNAWYQIKPLQPAHVVCPRFFDRRFFFAQCVNELSEDQTFYGVTLHDKSKAHWVSALLNSTLSYFLVEYLGRSNLGEGVLQYSRQDMATLPVVNPDLYSESDKKASLEAYQSMIQRPIESIETEVQQNDRMALDAIILKPFAEETGRLVTEIREQLVQSLLEGVNHRTSRNRRRKKPESNL